MTDGERIAARWWPVGQRVFICICHTMVPDGGNGRGAALDEHFAENGTTASCPTWIDHWFPKRYGGDDD